MFHVVDKAVYSMAGLRFLSSLCEFTGAVLMLYFGTATRALQVNGALSLVGPFVLVAVTAIGVIGISGEISWSRIALILVGVALILFGSRA